MIAEDLRTIIYTLDQIQKDYEWAYAQVGLCDKETQDILHSMELDKIDKNQRNKMATRLQRIRRIRRENKDLVEINEPIVDFLQSNRGQQMQNLLKEVLGKTRKVEEYHATRTYKPRVRKE